MISAVNRRRLRFAIIAAVALVALIVVGLVTLPLVARRLVVWQLGVATGRPVSVDAVQLRVFRGYAAVRGVRVMDRDGAVLATLDRLEARVRPLSLFRGRLHLVDGTLDALTIRIVRIGPRAFNVSDLLARQTGGGGRIVVSAIDRFTVRKVAVLVEDRTLEPVRTWRVELEGDVQNASARAEAAAGAASLRATVAGAPLSVQVTDLRLAPLRLRAALTARDIDTSLAALALPPDSLVRVSRGTVSASATLDHDAATGSLIAADIRLAGLELQRYHTAFLTAPAVRVTVDDVRLRGATIEVGRAGVDGGSVTLADAQLGTSRRWTLDGVTLEALRLSSARDAPAGTAKGSASMAGARISLWAANVRLAPLELHATTIVRNVDLAVLRAYLPPALPALPERGLVNATLTVEHGARGTRLALDAGMDGIEVARPGHVVTAPAVRVIVDEVVLEAGGATVKRATVTSARLTLEERSVTPVRRWVVQNLAIEGKDLSSRPDAAEGIASLQATVAGASVSAWMTRVRLAPLALHVTANVRNADLHLLRLYLPPEAPVEFTRGTIDAAVDIDYSAADGTRVAGDATLAAMEARGRWQLSTLRATAPSVRVTIADARRRNETLSVGRVEVNGTGSLVDSRSAASRLDFNRLHVATEGLTWPVRTPARVEVGARFGDRGELDAKGTAQLTAPLPAVAWSADLALSFRRVDLTPLGVYVPIARGVGGRVRASVTATINSAPTLTARIRGDVAGGRFALAEGDRTLLALRRIDAKGLDVQWPERITIAEVRLREPYALVERDREGRVVLMDRFAGDASADASQAPPPADARRPLPPISIAQVIVERGKAQIVDASGGSPLRVDLPSVTLTAQDVTWPASSAPTRVAVDVGLEGGGSAKIEGTVTGEPHSVDLKITLAGADLTTLQPLLPFRAVIRGRLDTTLAVSGPLAPAPKLSVRGDSRIRSFAVADGTAPPLITVERMDVTGIGGVWPEQITVDRARIRRSWARLERDRQGGFPLRALFEYRTPRSAPPSVGPPSTGATAGAATGLLVRELVLEQQAATIIDAVPAPAATFDVAGASLTVQNLNWPAHTPMTAILSSPMPGGGRLTGSGTLDLEPFRLDARVKLDAVSIDPAQSYVPIEGVVAGQVTGELAVNLGLQPLTVKITGQTQLQRFRLNDGDRPVITVARVDVSGIDVDWPRRLGIESVRMRRPRLLVERDALGEIRLWRVAMPDWNRALAVPTAATAPRPGDATAAAPGAGSSPSDPPVIDIATFRLERASARFVDQSTTPTFAEELSDVELTASPLTSDPARRTRFTVTGHVGGGTVKAAGTAAMGERASVDVTVELRDYIVPRANPFLDLYTGWIATRGGLTLTGTYTLNGTRLETRQEVIVRDLDVEPVDTRDEVAHRVGLPFGLLLSVLKDSRGTVKLAIPVSGDLASRTFDFQDAVWGAVRALALRLVALPFSRIGSLFVSEDSKVEAVAITPVLFDPGTSRLASGMDAHLQKVAGFLRDAPAVTLELAPVFTQADADALKADEASESLRTLGEQRLATVRESLGRAGIAAGRLPGRVSRRPLIEAAGSSRVELNPRATEAPDRTPRGG
jgi:hypothetical protein